MGRSSAARRARASASSSWPASASRNARALIAGVSPGLRRSATRRSSIAPTVSPPAARCMPRSRQYRACPGSSAMAVSRRPMATSPSPLRAAACEASNATAAARVEAMATNATTPAAPMAAVRHDGDHSRSVAGTAGAASANQQIAITTRNEVSVGLSVNDMRTNKPSPATASGIRAVAGAGDADDGCRAEGRDGREAEHAGLHQDLDDGAIGMPAHPVVEDEVVAQRERLAEASGSGSGERVRRAMLRGSAPRSGPSGRAWLDVVSRAIRSGNDPLMARTTTAPATIAAATRATPPVADERPRNPHERDDSEREPHGPRARHVDQQQAQGRARPTDDADAAAPGQQEHRRKEEREEHADHMEGAVRPGGQQKVERWDRPNGVEPREPDRPPQPDEDQEESKPAERAGW